MRKSLLELNRYLGLDCFWPGSKCNLLISFTYSGHILVCDCLYCVLF